MTQAPLPYAEERATLFGRMARKFRTALVHGLVVALPIAITFWILYWLYTTLRNMVIDPIAHLLLWAFYGRALYREDFELPLWIEHFAAPAVAVVVLVCFLFAAGLFFKSRLHSLIDAILTRAPIVTNIYTSVSRVVLAIATPESQRRFQRVVLVDFPHRGVKCPAFVTSTCRDVTTGETILCVYVPTTPIPTSGYMLMLPERDVLELDWDLNETLQAVVSGGITVPRTVTFHPPGTQQNQS